MKYIFIDDLIPYFLNKDMEVRIDYVSAITDKHVIPIYFFSCEQICSKTFVDYNLKKENFLNLNEEIITKKISLLKDLGFNIKRLSLTDNLHTHPGKFSWSRIDYDGCLKSDFSEESIIGSNLLFTFDGEFIDAVLREKNGKNDKYTYTPLKPIYGSPVAPHYDIDNSHFKKREEKLFPFF